jgi:hypothetical protein
LIELKNGKLVCRQKPFAISDQIASVEGQSRSHVDVFAKVRKERVKLAKCLSEMDKIEEIPDDHYPAIAKLIQESSVLYFPHRSFLTAHPVTSPCWT